MNFCEKPELLNLTPLEEWLISPCIPFMQIRELPRGGLLSIHGNIVNVPSDVNSNVHCLPRLMNESQPIPIKLKRSLSYAHHYQFQNVRPKKVLDAAKYLVDTSDLFKSEGIEVQNAWLDNTSLQSSTHEEWSGFFQNPDTSSGDLQTYEVVEKMKFKIAKTVFPLLMLIIQRMKKVTVMAGVKLMNPLQGLQTHYYMKP